MPYTFRQSDLPKLDLDLDKGTDFAIWKKKWTSYRTLSGLERENAATQVNVLNLCLSNEALRIVENLGLTDAQK